MKNNTIKTPKLKYRCVAVVLITSLLLTSPPVLISAENSIGSDLPIMQMRDKVDDYERQAWQKLSNQEQCQLAIGYLGIAQYEKALYLAEQLKKVCNTPQEYEMVYQIIVLANTGLGRHEKAAEQALIGQRYSPQSEELARARIVCFEHIKDYAQCQAAYDHLVKLVGDQGNKNVIAGVDDAAIVMIVVAAMLCATAVTAFYYTDKNPANGEHIAKVAVALFACVSSANLFNPVNLLK